MKIFFFLLSLAYSAEYYPSSGFTYIARRDMGTLQKNATSSLLNTIHTTSNSNITSNAIFLVEASVSRLEDDQIDRFLAACLSIRPEGMNAEGSVHIIRSVRALPASLWGFFVEFSNSNPDYFNFVSPEKLSKRLLALKKTTKDTDLTQEQFQNTLNFLKVLNHKKN